MKDNKICVRLIPPVMFASWAKITDCSLALISFVMLLVSKKVSSAIVDIIIVSIIQSINWVSPTAATPSIFPIIS